MSSTLIHNVRIFDGESVITENGCILFSNGLVQHVSLATPSPPLSADHIIDGTGHTILPGLIDAHVHIGDDEQHLAQCLAFGVTTVLEMFGEPENVSKVKKICGQRMDVADLKSACHGATIKGGWPGAPLLAFAEDKEATMKVISNWPDIQTPEDAKEFVRSNVEKGADYIKLFHEGASGMVTGLLPTPTPEAQAAVISAAHSHGLVAVAHAFAQKDTLTILKAGVDGLAHCFFDEPPTAELVEAYKTNNAFVVPTLIIAASLTGEEEESREEHAKHELAGKLLDEAKRTCLCGKFLVTKKACKIEYAYQAVRMLKDAALDVVAGTDSGPGLPGTAFGLSLHHELSLYTSRCNFTPIEALRSATSTTARRFKLEDRGRLAEGLRADVLMVKGDPTQDTSCTMNIAGVWRGGEALKNY